MSHSNYLTFIFSFNDAANCATDASPGYMLMSLIHSGISGDITVQRVKVLIWSDVVALHQHVFFCSVLFVLAYT